MAWNAAQLGQGRCRKAGEVTAPRCRMLRIPPGPCWDSTLPLVSSPDLLLRGSSVTGAGPRECWSCDRGLGWILGTFPRAPEGLDNAPRDAQGGIWGICAGVGLAEPWGSFPSQDIL